MATYTIPAGKHYHRLPPFSTLPWVGKQSMVRLVTFAPECAYDSAPYNERDVNKLFGLSFGFGGVHHNSARFGWRYSMADKCIELLAYCYVDGRRNWDEQLRFPVVAQVQPGEKLLLEIQYEPDGYTFSVHSAEDGRYGGFIGCRSVNANVPHGLPRLGLTHGLYFGGTLAAPHTMAVRIDRV